MVHVAAGDRAAGGVLVHGRGAIGRARCHVTLKALGVQSLLRDLDITLCNSLRHLGAMYLYVFSSHSSL